MSNQTWITDLDWVIAPVYIIIAIYLANSIKRKNILNNQAYQYFTLGLIAKLTGGVGLALVYVFYYKGRGDTISYHTDGVVCVNMLLRSPMNFFELMFSPRTAEVYTYFSNETGFPDYWKDEHAFNMVRFVAPLELLGFCGYLTTSVLMAIVVYSGTWKLYLTFCDCYPNLYRQFAFSVLFIPSVCFWGSGILKDSMTLAAAGWYCHSFYKLFIKKEIRFFLLFSIALSTLVMILIKPYIFVALLPGSLLWVTWNRLYKIKSVFIRIVVAPVIIFFGIGVGVLFWLTVSSGLGDYGNLNSMLQKALITSEDLKQDYYKGNSFDIGAFDPTISGVLAKFPIATVTGLFRPFLWESNNIVMFISGLENFFLLFFTVFFLLKRPASFLSSLFTNPLVLFCLIFGVFFAFSVALSTSNFGAMVRLRIPAIPFFITGLILVEYLSREKENILNETRLYRKFM